MMGDLDEAVRYANGYHPDGHYPLALVNVTNRCNLSCAHCFVFRDDNPNESVGARKEPSTDNLIALLGALRDRHGIHSMLWMGGEPLLRKDLLRRGVGVFSQNLVVTNGTLPLVDLGPDVLYVVSLDGPEQVNDEIRGAGSFRRVMKMLDHLPDDFTTPVQVQCTVTTRNQGHLAELAEALRGTRVGWMTFSFVVPAEHDVTGLAWETLEDRMPAVEEVRRVKEQYPGFVRNRTLSLDLMAPDAARDVTASCLTKQLLLPLWLDGDRFTTPFCCYGDDVDCTRCGAWVVFEMAARFQRTA